MAAIQHNELNRGKKSILTEDNALFASKAKINFFEIFSSGESLKETHSEEFLTTRRRVGH